MSLITVSLSFSPISHRVLYNTTGGTKLYSAYKHVHCRVGVLPDPLIKMLYITVCDCLTPSLFNTQNCKGHLVVPPFSASPLKLQ